VGASTSTRGPWGVIDTDLGEDNIRQLAHSMAQRGKLPGFRAPGRDGAVFTLSAFGAPFDHELDARASRTDSGLRLEFHHRVLLKLPVIMGVLIALSVWPGLPLTDSLLRTYFPSYAFRTWMWYLPLTIVPLPPLLLRMWKASRAASHEHAQETIALLRAELERAKNGP
jgi:hypothetical protein